MKTFPKPLSAREEKEYLERCKEGDQSARDVLIERNMRLVAHVVKKYQSPDYDMEDLLSVGTIGLIKAVNTFKVDKGSRLATYAAKCVENEILMLLRASKKLSKEVSLFEPIGVDKDGEAVSLVDIIEMDNKETIDTMILKQDVKELYEAFESCLTDTEKTVIRMRYGLYLSLIHICEDYGMENPFRYPPDKDSPVFEKIYLALQLVENVSEMTEQGKNVKSETGKLVYGNGNPHAEEFNSMSDFIVSGDEIELRLPWQLLNFSNPSEMQIHDDYFENYGIENLGIDRIYLGVGRKAEKGERINLVPMRLKGWGKHPTYHERLKRSYYRMQELWADGASDERKDQ